MRRVERGTLGQENPPPFLVLIDLHHELGWTAREFGRLAKHTTIGAELRDGDKTLAHNEV